MESGIHIAGQLTMRQLVIPVGRSFTADDSIYGVRVIGEERPDGKWDARIEFRSGSGICLSAVTSEHDTSDQVSEWAANIEDETLRFALRRASTGPIERIKPAK